MQSSHRGQWPPWLPHRTATGGHSIRHMPFRIVGPFVLRLFFLDICIEIHIFFYPRDAMLTTLKGVPPSVGLKQGRGG